MKRIAHISVDARHGKSGGQRERFPRPLPSNSKRHGSALLLVLAVVGLLSLAAWTYCDVMLIEFETVAAHSVQIEKRLLVESAVDYTRSRLLQSGQTPAEHSIPAFVGWSSVSGPQRLSQFHVAHRDRDQLNVETVPGPFNLSGLIDVNAFFEIEAFHGRDVAMSILMALPEMSEEVAEQIVDRKQPFKSLRQVAELRNSSIEQLFGEDLNRNGLLDENEDFNNNGRLDEGWAKYLTITAGESTRRADGTKKIHINQSSLLNLFEELKPKFGEKAARYVVAFRMHGALSDAYLDIELSRDAKQQQALKRGAIQRGEAEWKAPDATDESGKVVAGLNLAIGPVVRIESLADLFGTSVRTLVNGQDTILNSPWPGDAETVEKVMPQLKDELVLTDQRRLKGRINILSAPMDVLMAIPGMKYRIASTIAKKRRQLEDKPKTIAWLLTQNITTHADFRRLAKHITVDGDFFEAIIIGEIPRRGHRSISAVRIRLDVSGREPRPTLFHILPMTESREWLMALPGPVESHGSVKSRFAGSVDVGHEVPIRY